MREDRWYEEARAGWHAIYREGLEECEGVRNATIPPPAGHHIRCHDCNRDFRRPSDMARNKCILEAYVRAEGLSAVQEMWQMAPDPGEVTHVGAVAELSL